MTVEVLAQFEDMVEQLVIANGLDAPEDVVERAVQAMHATLSDDQKTLALNRMIESGCNSGVYPGDPIAEMLAEMHQELEQKRQAAVKTQQPRCASSTQGWPHATFMVFADTPTVSGV
jgi:aspartate/methionine/tyrosine aminotransferase